MAQPFFSLFMKSASLAFEAQQVIALRTMRLALGGVSAEREVRRMVSEKSSAAAEIGLNAAMGLAGGKSGASIANAAIRDYRTRVRKNRKRLTRSGK